MKVSCERCASIHEIEPPAWVVASGRPFDMVCPSCAHRQRVRPQAPTLRDAAFLGSPATDSSSGARRNGRLLSRKRGHTYDEGGSTDDDATRPGQAIPRSALPMMPSIQSPSPVTPSLADAFADVSYDAVMSSDRTSFRETPRAGKPLLPTEDSELDDAQPIPFVGREVSGTIVDGANGHVFHQASHGPSPDPDAAFSLHQDGRTFRVPDLATLQRWIIERRINRDDLLSERGSPWRPVVDRPDLAVFFSAVERIEALEVNESGGTTTAEPLQARSRTPVLGGKAPAPADAPSWGLGALDSDDENETTVESLSPVTEEYHFTGTGSDEDLNPFGLRARGNRRGEVTDPTDPPAAAKARPPEYTDEEPVYVRQASQPSGDSSAGGGPRVVLPAHLQAAPEPAPAPSAAPPAPQRGPRLAVAEQAEAPRRRPASDGTSWSTVFVVVMMLIGALGLIQAATGVSLAALWSGDSVGMDGSFSQPRPTVEEAWRLMDQQQNPSAAYKVLQETLNTTPDDPQAHFATGVALHRLGRFQESRNHLCRVFKQVEAKDQERIKRYLTESGSKGCP